MESSLRMNELQMEKGSRSQRQLRSGRQQAEQNECEPGGIVHGIVHGQRREEADQSRTELYSGTVKQRLEEHLTALI